MKLALAYLGLRNNCSGKAHTYSEKAAEILAAKIKADVRLLPQGSLEEVARTLADGEADLAVMAGYNLLAGPVKKSQDLIYDNDFYIIAAQRLRIELSIATWPGNTDCSKVYSHEMAFAQCSQYLSENYPDIEQVPAESTAAGAVKVAETRSGLVIAHIDALQENGLEVIAQDIGNKVDGRKNFTDFYLVSAEENLRWELTLKRPKL